MRKTMEEVKKIRQRLEIAPSRPKSYTDKRMRTLQFQANNVVFLKVAPLKGVMSPKKNRKTKP